MLPLSSRSRDIKNYQESVLSIGSLSKYPRWEISAEIPVETSVWSNYLRVFGFNDDTGV